MTSATNPPDVLVEHDEGTARWLTVNRPEVHNALNASVMDAFGGALDRVEESEHVRAVVIIGAGARAFSAGADLDELTGIDVTAAERLLQRGGEVTRRLEALEVPVIAAVNGLALGGGFELALACTLIVASEHASFGLPETGLGLMPGYGGTQRLQRQIGAQAARLAVLTGERIDAHEAHRLGLLARGPSPERDHVGDVRAIVERIASRGPVATAWALQALRSGEDAPLPVGLRLERSLAAMCIASDDGAEGIQAFRERRPPTFDASHAAP